MNEIFMSYARTDAGKAKAMAEALTRSGHSVWWDRDIPPGQSFDKVIEEALTQAKCVVVLWSQASTSSDWVKTEAAEGAKRGVLVPVLVEKVAIPLEFRILQTADLSEWHGDLADPIFAQFVSAIGKLLGDERKVDFAAPSLTDQKSSTSIMIRPVAVIIGLVVDAEPPCPIGGRAYEPRRDERQGNPGNRCQRQRFGKHLDRRRSGIKLEIRWDSAGREEYQSTPDMGIVRTIVERSLPPALALPSAQIRNPSQ